MQSLATLLGVGRAAFGAALIVAPDLMSRRMFGGETTSVAGRLFARGGGLRDLVLGVGVALAPPTSGARAALLGMSAACDAGDCLLVVVDTAGVPPSNRRMLVLQTGLLAIVHLGLAWRSDAGRRT